LALKDVKAQQFMDLSSEEGGFSQAKKLIGAITGLQENPNAETVDMLMSVKQSL
jgi:hypothetical protein